MNYFAYYLPFLISAFILIYPNHTNAQTAREQNIATLEQTSRAIRSVIQTAKPAIVHIFIEKKFDSSQDTPASEQINLFKDPFFDDFFGSPTRRNGKPQRKRGHGSGFLINKDGYILTNSHLE